MNDVVVLDTGPLGLMTNPADVPEVVACNEWLDALLARGVRVIIPEIADYEVRRELVRARKTQGLATLDRFKSSLEYVPITTEAMLQAAAFWALARQQGRPTADEKALDGDVILAAQTATLRAREIIVATTNVGHIARFVPADEWRNLR